MLTRPRKFGRIGLALLAGIFVHSAWWLLVSAGRPRYMVIALVPALFLICLPIATARSGPELLGFAGLVVLLSFPCWGRLGYPLQRVKVGTLATSERNRHGLEVTRVLEERAAGRTVFTEGWAMVSALEYQSNSKILFQPIGVAAGRDPRQDYFVVLDDRFLIPGDQVLTELVSSCGGPAVDLAPYRVFHCAATQPR